MIMEFKNYCVVAIGKVDGIREVIINLSETEPRLLEQKGVFIATFTCAMTAKELGDILDREDKTFFIFEVGDKSNSYKIGRDDIHNQLFGYMETQEESRILDVSDLLNKINISGKTNSTNIVLPLSEQLNIAIEDEDYDKAAELRDLIKLNNQNK